MMLSTYTTLNNKRIPPPITPHWEVDHHLPQLRFHRFHMFNVFNSRCDSRSHIKNKVFHMRGSLPSEFIDDRLTYFVAEHKLRNGNG
jgi:hypothetical protein